MKTEETSNAVVSYLDLEDALPIERNTQLHNNGQALMHTLSHMTNARLPFCTARPLHPLSFFTYFGNTKPAPRGECREKSKKVRTSESDPPPTFYTPRIMADSSRPPSGNPSPPPEPNPAASNPKVTPSTGTGTAPAAAAAGPSKEPLTGFRTSLEHTGIPRSVLTWKPRLPSRNWSIIPHCRGHNLVPLLL